MIKILVLGCNHDQVPYLKELKGKYYIIGSDLNTDAPGKMFCDTFHNVGYDDFKGLIEIGKIENFGPNDKVFTAGAQFAHIGAAHFANEFKIPYPTVKSVEICLDKVKFYKFFQENDLPIPETYLISNIEELNKRISQKGIDKSYYLKSDFSKNPNYVYRFYGNKVQDVNIFWGRDRYLHNHYILQEEFIGEHLRINIIGDDFILFPVDLKQKLRSTKSDIINRGIVKKLKSVVDALGFTNWLVKFDVIFGEDDYVVLDIGMDPPYRLNKYYNEKNISLPNYYLDQYLENKINYPIMNYEQ